MIYEGGTCKMNLEQLFIEYPDCVNNEKLMRGYLADLFPNEIKETHLIVYAYKLGIIEKMQKAKLLDSYLYNQLLVLMDTTYGVSEENAKWAIRFWFEAYGVSVLQKKLCVLENETNMQINDVKANNILQESNKKMQEENKKSLQYNNKSQEDNNKLKKTTIQNNSGHICNEIPTQTEKKGKAGIRGLAVGCIGIIIVLVLLIMNKVDSSSKAESELPVVSDLELEAIDLYQNAKSLLTGVPYEWIYDDFDGDGTKELFIQTQLNTSTDYTEIEYALWFLGEGKTKCLIKSGALWYLMPEDKIVLNNMKFLVLSARHGYYTIYGVQNGVPTEVDILSNESFYYIVQEEENGVVYGSDKFENDIHLLEFDSSRFTFNDISG